MTTITKEYTREVDGVELRVELDLVKIREDNSVVANGRRFDGEILVQECTGLLFNRENCPDLHPDVIISTAETAYLKNELPTDAWLKGDIQEYCTLSGIEFEESDTKAELLSKLIDGDITQ